MDASGRFLSPYPIGLLRFGAL